MKYELNPSLYVQEFPSWEPTVWTSSGSPRDGGNILALYFTCVVLGDLWDCGFAPAHPDLPVDVPL